jgi:DNA-binding NarL/FixJ family response regulator
MAVWLINPLEHAARPVPRHVPGARALTERFASLTGREREVVGAAARGQSDAQIAVGAYLSPIMVETHVSSAMIKLGVHDRAQLVGCARRAGLLG